MLTGPQKVYIFNKTIFVRNQTYERVFPGTVALAEIKFGE
jgi:hypothetical protein